MSDSPEPLDLGFQTVDVAALSRQLRRDLRDDWYPDPLGYEDLLAPSRLASCLHSALATTDGSFPPEPRLALDIPKPGFILRYSLESSLLDRAYYHCLTSYLLPFYDHLIPRNVLSYRVAAAEDKSNRYLFNAPVAQWKLFQRYTAAELKQSPSS